MKYCTAKNAKLKQHCLCDLCVLCGEIKRKKTFNPRESVSYDDSIFHLFLCSPAACYLHLLHSSGGVCSGELYSSRWRIPIDTHLLPACGLDAEGRPGAGCEPDASTKTAPHLYVFAALSPPPNHCTCGCVVPAPARPPLLLNPTACAWDDQHAGGGLG